RQSEHITVAIMNFESCWYIPLPPQQVLARVPNVSAYRWVLSLFHRASEGPIVGPRTKGNMPHEKYIDCIEACNHCANECTHCASECLREEDVKMMVRCIELDRDCSVLCRTASLLMSADSQFASELCRVCAEACRAC